MDVKIDFTKSAQENANGYYNRAKKLLSKREGAEKAIRELEGSLAEARESEQKDEKRRVIKLREKKWYEKFHWFYASDGRLVVGGRDAKQNEMINSKHFDDKDLFFHADIFGASVTVLKEGVDAGEDVRREVAQFAASYSSAWKEALQNIDVYAMRREQVTKSTSRGSIGTGSFLLSGEREWFRGTALGLAMFARDNILNVVPLMMAGKLDMRDKAVEITIGRDKKSDAAKKIAKLVGYEDLDEIILQLPAGNFHVKPLFGQATPKESA